MGQEIRGRAYILEGTQTNLLGKPEIRNLELVRTVRNICSGHIESRHPKLFSKLGILPDVFKINIKEGAKPLCLYVPMRLPIVLRKATQKELERMECLGVIERVKKPTGMVVAPKSSCKVNICVDPSELNKSVKRETFSLPLEETLSSSAWSQYFSKMDTKTGFW